MKRILFTILLILIAISAQAVEKIQEYESDTVLPEGWGYLIIGTHSPNPDISIRFKSRQGAFKTESFPAGHQYKLLLLPQGEFRVESLWVKKLRMTMSQKSYFKGWKFNIQPGKLNYMGEVALSGNDLSRFVNLETISKISQRLYPEVAQAYELIYTGE